MPPLVPFVAGIAALVVALVVLRSSGERYRVARLLGSARAVTVGEARTLAAGPGRYIRLQGRIDSATDFEDDAHRPLVFRRTRVQLGAGASWTDLDDRRERVPFELRDRLESIAIDDEALDAGLVVVVRESIGTAADAPERMPPGTDPSARVRLLIEQVSSVEHATVVGVPGLAADGSPRITAGLGRPLILTTMDRSEAMRVLADGSPLRPLLAPILLVAGLAFVALGLVLGLIGLLA